MMKFFMNINTSKKKNVDDAIICGKSMESDYQILRNVFLTENEIINRMSNKNKDQIYKTILK